MLQTKFATCTPASAVPLIFKQLIHWFLMSEVILSRHDDSMKFFKVLRMISVNSCFYGRLKRRKKRKPAWRKKGKI